MTPEKEKEWEAAIVEHKLRLENGVKAFTDLKQDLADVKAQIKPKPINWLTIFFSGIGVVVTILSAWWALSTKFSERPTSEQIEKMFNRHSGETHPSEGVRLDQLQNAQNEQRRVLDRIEQRQQQNSDELQEMKTDLKALRRGR